MIVLTGATNGLGLALARHLAEQGQRQILVGRRALSELKDPLFTDETYCRADLAETGGECIAEFLDARGIEPVDHLIHNAALGFHGPVEAQSPESIRALVAVNLSAPMAITQALLPRVAVCRGKITFISSVAAGLPCPKAAVYAATKAALDAFARSLRVELAGSGVRVQVIHPGAVNTGVHARAGATRGEMNWDRFPSVETVLPRLVRALEGNRTSVSLGVGNGLIHWAGCHFPRVIDAIVTRRQS